MSQIKKIALINWFSFVRYLSLLSLLNKAETHPHVLISSIYVLRRMKTHDVYHCKNID